MNWLSRTMVFIIPILLVTGFLAGSFYQVKLSSDTNKTIIRTDGYIEFIEDVLSDDELMFKENVRALKKLLTDDLKYSNLSFDSFWLYKVLLVTPDGEVIDIEQAAAAEAESEEYLQSSKPINLEIIGEKEKKYTLHIIELNSFIYNTPDEELRQFPKPLLEESNGERLSQLAHSSLISKSAIAYNKIETEYSSAKDDTASYSYLKIEFVLNTAFTFSFPPSWSNWWQSGVSCSSLRLELE